jgi:hypothetical protein
MLKHHKALAIKIPTKPILATNQVVGSLNLLGNRNLSITRLSRKAISSKQRFCGIRFCKS